MQAKRYRLLLSAILISIMSCSPLQNFAEQFGGADSATETPEPALPPGPTATPEEPTAADLDFGDAPDPGFPSLLASDGARAAPGSFWLGELASPPSAESEAKVVDQDELDDGLIRLLVTPGKVLVTFQAVLAEPAEPRVAYFNLLADVNGDGRWQAFQGQAGTVQEWAVVNREVPLNPGEGQAIATEFPFLQPGNELWFRVTLTDRPVEGPDWDGTGLFDEGEVEDYKLPSGPSADWNFDCDPDPLVLDHGEFGAIGFVQVAGVGAPLRLRVVGAVGPVGTLGDPFADEIGIDPPPDPFGAGRAFPDFIVVKSLVVHGPLHSKAYTIIVRLEGPGRVETEKCLVNVQHWDPWLPVAVDDDSVVYTGPPQVKSGGTLRARFQVSDANGRPAQGEFFGTLGDPPGDRRASHASGQLDAEGRITFELPVNWPPGMTVLYFSWRGQVFAIAQIEVLP